MFSVFFTEARMKSALPKIAIVALVIASFALLYSAKSSAWTEYLMDPNNTDVFDEYEVTPNGTQIEMSYTGNSYWRQIAPKYRISNGTIPGLVVHPGTADQTPSITLPFDNTSTASLTQAPPIKVPGFVNGSTVTETYTNVNNVTVTGNGTSSGDTTGGSKWYPTVVNGGGTSSGTTGTTTGTTGSGGIIVIPSR